jgi:hypothetical protein
MVCCGRAIIGAAAGAVAALGVGVGAGAGVDALLHPKSARRSGAAERIRFMRG